MAINSAIKLRSVFRVVSWLILLEGAFLVLPLAVSLIYGESDWWTFVVAIGCALVAGGSGTFLLRRSSPKLHRLDAYLLTTLIWICYSLIGMIPFALGPHGIDVTSAFFETMSGFTTTGASVFQDVESLSHGILFWRSLTQWIGGLGIVLFILAVLPALNRDGGISMFNAEMTGITHDKLHPRIRQTAMSLWLVYLVLTVVMILLLWLGPMNLFDSVCHTFATLSTGGFSTHNSSITSFGSHYVAIVVTIFMLIGGVNFALLYNAARGKVRALFRDTVFRTFIGIVLVLYVLMVAAVWLKGDLESTGDILIQPLFIIASAITTTGFTYGDFTAWGSFVLCLIFLMMFSGACAGSTTGAIKIDRLIAVGKSLRNEMMLTLFPNRLTRVDISGRQIPTGKLRRVALFIILYFVLIGLGTMAATISGLDFTDAFFASASCTGNNGLGYGATANSYGSLAPWLKWIFSFLMLTGRLELFTVLAIFTPSFWRE